MTVEKLRNFSTAKSRSLKDSTRLPLLFILGGNIAIFYVAMKTGTLATDGLEQLARSWRELIPAGASFVLFNVFNYLVDSTNKARLVFWRWRDPLPGSRAFTEYARTDPRIDVAALKRKYGPFPKPAPAQNALWYRLYKTVVDRPAVSQAHRQYLLTRDYAAGSVLLLITLGTAGFWIIPSRTTAVIYAALLLLQYLLARQAANNHGIRFVTSVLAIKAAE